MGGIYWLASYPKSGNTWMRIFLQNLLAGSDAPININSMPSHRIASSREWIDDVLGFDSADMSADEIDQLRPAVYAWAMREPGIGYHKIHDAYTHTHTGEPLTGRNGTLGALYIIRNPLDIVPSLSHHNGCSLNEAIDQIADPNFALSDSRDALPSQLRQRLLTWSGHVESWTNAENLNLEVLRYEDMLSDPLPTFTRATRFLNLSHTVQSIQRAIEHSSFEELKKQELSGGFRERTTEARSFFRQGKSGNWRTNLSENQVARIIESHAQIMQRYGYLDNNGSPE
jgi:hypothetical protein